MSRASTIVDTVPTYSREDRALKTYLDRILESHRQAAAADARLLDALIAQTTELVPARGFRQALVDCEGLGVISEIKRRSPSKGDLNPGIEPGAWAASYEAGGATCLSVLTDTEFFGGSPEDLSIARSAVSLPVLRKDFTVSANDVVDARLMGADCVLLIVAALDEVELLDFHQLAIEIGLDVLVETHDEYEVDRALTVGATLVGVNQRDLVTFEVDTDRAVRVGAALPKHVVRVAESGVTGAADATVLRSAGYHAVLVGETLVRSADPTEAVRQLRAS